ADAAAELWRHLGGVAAGRHGHRDGGAGAPAGAHALTFGPGCSPGANLRRMIRPTLSRPARAFPLALLAFIPVGCATQAPPAPATLVQVPVPAIHPVGNPIEAPPAGGGNAMPALPSDADLATKRAAFIAATSARFDIPPAEIAAVLDGAKIQDSIIAAMSRPAERTRAWHEYRPIF